VYSSPEEHNVIGTGEFPRVKSLTSIENNTRNTLEEPLADYNTFDDAHHMDSLFSQSTAEEPPPNRSLFAILKTFTDYMGLY
jgi:hypothetical protein